MAFSAVREAAKVSVPAPCRGWVPSGPCRPKSHVYARGLPAGVGERVKPPFRFSTGGGVSPGTATKACLLLRRPQPPPHLRDGSERCSRSKLLGQELGQGAGPGLKRIRDQWLSLAWRLRLMCLRLFTTALILQWCRGRTRAFLMSVSTDQCSAEAHRSAGCPRVLSTLFPLAASPRACFSARGPTKPFAPLFAGSSETAYGSVEIIPKSVQCRGRQYTRPQHPQPHPPDRRPRAL
jgi:hypothetical protein